MILSERVSGKLPWWGVAAAMSLALAALPAWSIAQQAEPPPQPSALMLGLKMLEGGGGDGEPTNEKPSVASDPKLLELIEAGKFEEAKARLDSLKSKQAADNAITKGVFPQKWTEALLKDLPRECVKGLDEKAAIEWKACQKCHAMPWPVEDLRGTITFSPDESKGVGEHIRRAEARHALTRAEAGQRHYLVVVQGQTPLLIANNDAGKVLWQTQFANSLAGRSNKDSWSIQETKDGKTVVLTWTRREDRMQYTIDAATGKVIQVLNTANPESEANNKFGYERKVLRNWMEGVSPKTDPSATPSNRIAEYEKAYRAQTAAGQLQRAAAELEKATSQFDKQAAQTLAGSADMEDARAKLEALRKQQAQIVQHAEAAYKLAEAEMAKSKSDFGRVQEIFKGEDQKNAEVEVALAKLRTAEAQVKQLQYLLEVARAHATVDFKTKSDDPREKQARDLVKSAMQASADGVPDAEIIKALYQKAMGRDPSHIESTYCVNFLSRSSQERQQAFENIVHQLLHDKEIKTPQPVQR